MPQVPDPGSPAVLSSILRFRWTSLAIVLGVTALSGVVGALGGSPATASASIALTTPSATSVLAPGVVGDASMSRYTAQRAEYVTSDEVLALVSSREGGIAVPALRGRVHAVPAATASLVKVTASADSAAAAASLANDVVQAYREATATEVTDRTNTAVAAITRSITRLEQEVRGVPATAPQVTAAGQSISQLQKQSSDLLTDSASFADGVDFVRAARPSEAVVPGIPKRDLAIGLLVGLALAALVAWLRADRDREVHRVDRAGELLGVPLLGMVAAAATGPRDADPILPRQSPSPDLQLLTSAVQKRLDGGVLVVLGAGPDATAAQLSLAMTQGLVHEGRSTMLIDADELAPSDRNPLPGNGSGALTATDTLTRMRTQHDYVVVDTAPLATSAVSASLVAAADGVVIVVPSGTSEKDLSRVRRSTEMLEARVLGYIYVGSAED